MTVDNFFLLWYSIKNLRKSSRTRLDG